MSCPCNPHFSCCGWWVGFACDRWWLFSLLWLLCLGHMCFDLPCCFSGLYLSLGGVGVFGRIWCLVWFALVQGEYGLLHWESSCLGYYPFEFGTWCLPPIWLGLRGSLWFALGWGGVGALACILYILLFSCILFTHLSHFASHVILACIFLIMLIIVLGWVLMRCETLLLDHAR
jgi:hypothetical protein